MCAPQVGARHDANLPPEAPVLPPPFFPGAPPQLTQAPEVQLPTIGRDAHGARLRDTHGTRDAPAPSLKLDLVHTYSAIAAPTSMPRAAPPALARSAYGDPSMDVVDSAPQWVEKATASSTASKHRRQDKDRKKEKKEKKEKKSKKKTKKGSKKKSKAKKARHRRHGDSTSSSDDDDADDRGTDAALLAKMRAVRGDVLPKEIARGRVRATGALPMRPPRPQTHAPASPRGAAPRRQRPSAADMFA